MRHNKKFQLQDLIIYFGLLCLLGTMSVVTASPATVPPEKNEGPLFQIDAMHSSVLFRIKHLDVANFYGRFNQVSGSFQVNEEDPGKSFIEVEIPTESVDSNNADRDRHLKSQDFFAAKEFPSITFKSKTVEKRADDVYLVTGDFTFRGKSKTVRFEARHTGTKKLNDRFGLRSGFEAEVTIKRSDFGDQYGVKDRVLGDEVRLIVSLEGVVKQ